MDGGGQQGEDCPTEHSQLEGAGCNPLDNMAGIQVKVHGLIECREKVTEFEEFF